MQNPLQLSIPSVGVLRHPDTAFVDDRAVFDETRLDVEWVALFWLAGEQHDGELVLTRDAARRVYSLSIQRRASHMAN